MREKPFEFEMPNLPVSIYKQNRRNKNKRKLKRVVRKFMKKETDKEKI